MKQIFTLFLFCVWSVVVWGQVTIAFQGFESTANDNWPITAGSGNVSSSVGSSDFPDDERIFSGSNSWQVNNETATLTLGEVNTSSYNSITITARLSSTALTSGNGSDGTDEVYFYVATDGGSFPVTADIEVQGNNNAKWGYDAYTINASNYTASGVASGTAGTPVIYTPAGGGYRESDAYHLVQITVSGTPGSVALEIVANNNANNEFWNIDDIEITGVLASSNSSDSDIIEAGFDEPDNIDYATYSATSGLTTGNAIKIGEFTIRDGGAGGSDTDSESTTLTAISFTVQNFSDFAALALFDGTTNVSEVTSVAAITSFTGLNLIASDDGTKSFNVYATFSSTVTDNDQVQLNVSSATADAGGSIFLAGNAGGASTDVTGDDNRIEVTATDLIFDQEPSDVNVNTAMSPSPTVLAVDGNVNTDVDFTNAVTLTTTGTFSGSATTSATPSNGVATFSNLIFSVAGTGLTISGAAIGVNSTGNSSTFNVNSVIAIRINEIDAQNPGTDSDEFVELYDNGLGNSSLDGLILVLFNGSGDISYDCIDLDGLSTDANGYFVIGNVASADYSTGIPSSNWLQNGEDAVALYRTASCFSNGTSATATNLEDVIVYDDGSSTDAGLEATFGVSTITNEGESVSAQRDPEFIGAFNTNSSPSPGASPPLPISLTSFTAQKINTATLIQWTTDTEINNDYMAVERSTDGRHFIEIGRVQGAGTTETPQHYQFIDEQPRTGLNYYRLLQVDFDGKFEYHQTIVVEFGEELTETIQVYPTNAKDKLQVLLPGNITKGATLQIIGVDGRIWSQTSLQEKTIQIELSVIALPAGSYWLKVIDGQSIQQAYFQKH